MFVKTMFVKKKKAYVYMTHILLVLKNLTNVFFFMSKMINVNS